ncbi:MAG: hypothetical protein ACI857_002077 [Arenicella sp.]|jgi:hypothetical protein
MILNAEGQMIDHNKAATFSLEKPDDKFKGTFLNDYIFSGKEIFSYIKTALKML